MSVRPTATLAELYVQNGLVGRARAIYGEMALGGDPRTAELARQRLEELGPSAGGRIEVLQTLLERIRQRRSLQHVRE